MGRKDSNAFIHFGNLAKEEFKDDFSKCLVNSQKINHVTSRFMEKSEMSDSKFGMEDQIS